MSHGLNRKERRKLGDKRILEILSNVQAETTIAFLAIPIRVLYRDFGFKDGKLEEFVNSMMAEYNEIKNMDEYAAKVTEETGVSLHRID